MLSNFSARQGCPSCQSHQSRVVAEIPYTDPLMVGFLERFYHGRLPPDTLGDASYRVVCCETCALIYQDPILDNAGMQVLYQDWIDDARSLQKKQQASAKLFRQYAAQVQTLKQLLPGRPDQLRILEFGMGWGYWSRMAQAHGFDVCGFELSKMRSTHARQMGLRVIDSLPPPPAQYHAIYANQVFEHLPDPLPTLSQLTELLMPNGIIYIRVPDGRGIAAKLARHGWQPEFNAIHPLEHINCFTRKTLIELATRVGLHVVHPPLRLNWGRIFSGLKRELADRWLSTHIFFKRA